MDVMNAVMNRKLLILLGPVAGPRDVRGDGQDGLVADEAASTGTRTGPLPRPWTRRPAPRERPTEAADAAKVAQDKPYKEAEYRTFPARRQPRGHLDGRAAAPAVRGVRPGRPDLRVHRRGDRLQDRRSAIRPARARVHEAPLRLLLPHRDLRSGADVHAHHPVSEVHELPDERVLSDLPPVRPALLRGSLLPLHLLLRLGEVPSAGASWSGARPQPGRHGHHVDRQFLAHVHDVAEGGLDAAGRSSPSRTRSTTTRGCRSTSIASSRTSPSADRSPPPTRPSSSSTRTPTRSARTTTGWATSATSSRSAPSCRCPSPATGSRRRFTPTRRRSGSR